jgi:hypothetical protein
LNGGRQDVSTHPSAAERLALCNASFQARTSGNDMSSEGEQAARVIEILWKRCEQTIVAHLN